MSNAPWITVAMSLIGQKEKPGAGDNPEIVELFKIAGFSSVTHDETPWCAAFVGACLRLAGYSNKHTLAAAGYLEFGRDLGKDPEPGCVVVLEPLVVGASGHVGFLDSVSDTHVNLLGGNQRDSVNVTSFAKSKVRAFRWPVEACPVASSTLIQNIQELAPEYVPPTLPSVHTAAFDEAVPWIEKWEGGYVDDPADPGGPTNRGVTIGTLERWRNSAVTKMDVRSLSQEEARQIYRALYWTPVRGDELPVGVSLMLFNAAILHGPHRAITFLQLSLNKSGADIEVDGEIGPQTLGAVEKASRIKLVSDYGAVQLAYLRSRSGWARYGDGWTDRLNEICRQAQSMAVREPSPIVIQQSTSVVTTTPTSQPTVSDTMNTDALLRLVISAATGKPLPVSGSADAKQGSNIDVSVIKAVGELLTKAAPAQSAPVLSPIDTFLGGPALAGKKTGIAIAAYVGLSILQALNVVGTATGEPAPSSASVVQTTAPAGSQVAATSVVAQPSQAASATPPGTKTPTGQILTILIAALGALGLTAKLDRFTQALSSNSSLKE